jgi:hypothetical protein
MQNISPIAKITSTVISTRIDTVGGRTKKAGK